MNQSEKVILTKYDTFRSVPFVNITDDMVRVTLNMPIKKWRKMKRIFNIEKLKKKS
ncbi:hypothetical protein KKF82_06590 [Patescibacteria group bacterium]|nr:hypothetical protein [Patescibacteria group bacterium]